jgi:hypothetical protein
MNGRKTAVGERYPSVQGAGKVVMWFRLTYRLTSATDRVPPEMSI